MISIRNVAIAIVPVAIVAVAAVVTYMIVSGDDSSPNFSDIRVEPGRVSCEAFDVMDGYSFRSIVVLDLKARAEGVAPDQDPSQQEGFIFTTDVTADVGGPGELQAVYVLPEQDVDTQQFVFTDGQIYHSLPGEPWELYPDPNFEIAYTPDGSCNAIAPDLFLADMEGTPETVSGIAATKYHFDELVTEFPDRHRAFGPGSDAARFVNNFAGDIWVADEGGYIIKMDLLGIGHYPNGRELHIGLFYELANVGAGFDIEPPI